MPRFQYLAIDADGRHKRGGVDAANESAARAMLVRKRLLPVEIGASEGGRRREAAADRSAPSGAKLSHKAVLLVTRQLATLIEAAVPVDEALAMIAAQQEQPAAQRIVADIQAGVVEGQRLADALARHPRSFSGLYRAAVAGGEQSGKLSFVLARLADYLERAHALRSKVTTAMIYPAALSFVAITVVVCLMIFVVPSLIEQFEQFDQRLPLLTQILIGVSRFLTAFWPLLLIALALGGWFIRVMLAREPVRAQLDGFLLRAPIIGRWVVAVNASRFIRAVSTLVSSGMPVLESVRAARESVGNLEVRKAVLRMAERIEEGEPFSQAMRRSGVIPPMVTYMAHSGENAGELPSMLDKAAAHLDQEFESFTASALSLLEPAIIVFMGLVVASIVLAIMLPILQLNRLAIG
ncbi:MAG: type II secretion system inner membrane protein GspF [Hyphomonadaceae bacterium]|nr:type II secretion system inner membrane protein GspF [Hyphomonadaceae bacterium]